MTVPACNTQSLELVRWAISIAVPALSGLVGVAVGAWLTGCRDREQRRLAYIEKQLKGFYSPMLGLRNEIRMLGGLRNRVQKTANAVWEGLCVQARNAGTNTLSALTERRGSEFSKIIEYDNKKLREEVMPAFRQMAKLFRENLWLAEPDTRSHYESLIEFVEIWNMWLAKSIPGEVVERLNHSEEKLKPFYQHLQETHDKLRNKLRDGSA